MKIIIECDPKEIAAYELALKDGKMDVDKVAKDLYDRLKKASNALC